MGIIGIAANPASGKDIRRLVSQATVFDNNEKTNILQRILLTVAAFGPHDVVLMPDRYNFGARLVKKSEQNSDKFPPDLFRVLDMPTQETAEDTTNFAGQMRLMAAALIVLGGDGTCRAAAKASGDIPTLPISTGTNNAFPSMCEGTAVGMAAAAIAGGYADAKKCSSKEKRIEIWKNNELIDIALVDAVFTRQIYGGTKAILDVNDIKSVFVTSCGPSNIGFSSLLGCYTLVRPEDEFGAYSAAHTGEWHKAAFSAGIIERVRMGPAKHLPLDVPIHVIPDEDGMIALDGEKEVHIKKGDRLRLVVRRNGPRVVNVKAALEAALQNGFYGAEEERRVAKAL